MPSPSTRRPLFPAALIAACCAACCCGCGALGLYSLGHSVLQHNHVLKPILPDDGEESAAGQRLMSDNGSSHGGRLPMERRAEDGASGTSPDEAIEPMGEKPCHP